MLPPFSRQSARIFCVLAYGGHRVGAGASTNESKSLRVTIPISFLFTACHRTRRLAVRNLQQVRVPYYRSILSSRCPIFQRCGWFLNDSISPRYHRSPHSHVDFRVWKGRQTASSYRLVASQVTLYLCRRKFIPGCGPRYLDLTANFVTIMNRVNNASMITNSFPITMRYLCLLRWI